jgi:hypothetical protein
MPYIVVDKRRENSAAVQAGCVAVNVDMHILNNGNILPCLRGRVLTCQKRAKQQLTFGLAPLTVIVCIEGQWSGSVMFGQHIFNSQLMKGTT